LPPHDCRQDRGERRHAILPRTFLRSPTSAWRRRQHPTPKGAVPQSALWAASAL